MKSVVQDYEKVDYDMTIKKCTLTLLQSKLSAGSAARNDKDF